MGSNKNEPVDVLIAGAGLAGLMMACQLDLHNITFRIIDKKTSPAIHSGALIVHARTLEILQQMGLAEKAVKLGIIAQTIHLQFNQHKKIALDISSIGKGLTKFPFLLMLEQWHTENLLIDFLKERGHLVENNTTFLSFKQDNGWITSRILKPDGTIEHVKSRILIGADGSNSIIRTQLNIPFSGKTQQSRLFISDCEARLPLPTRDICFSFDSDYTSGLFPLPGNRWRVDGHIPLIQKKEVCFEDVQNFFGHQISSAIELFSPSWFSVFHSHSRCAGTFRKNNCFLIGDAAHVHSPVGGQGMNTGLQDAHNLAWKLALFINDKASENILDTYEEERRPLALSIIRHTDRAYSFMTTPSFLVRFLRIRIIPLLLPMLLSWVQKNSKLRSRIFSSISGIGIKYTGSFLSDSLSSNHFPDSSPKPGERLPYLTYEKNGRKLTIYDDLGSTNFQLLVFGKVALPAPFQTVIDQYRDVMSVVTINREEETFTVFKSLGLKIEGCYLIRPDHFIAWRSQEFDAISLGLYFQKILK